MFASSVIVHFYCVYVPLLNTTIQLLLSHKLCDLRDIYLSKKKSLHSFLGSFKLQISSVPKRSGMSS